MRKLIVILCAAITLFYGCSDTITTNTTLSPEVYNLVQTITLPDNYTIALYVQGLDSLTYAYNKVFMKVTLGSTAQTTGSIKVYPQMRMTSHITHSTPVSDSFTYNPSSGYYEGFMIFNMPTSPPTLVWLTRFTYIDNLGNSHTADSVSQYTALHPERQLRYFYDNYDTMYYTLTLVQPFAPSPGMNDIGLLLHKSNVYELEFTHITDAQMHINVFKQDSLYQTSGNIDPVIGSGGIYHGAVSLPHTGMWSVGDTIIYNGRVITGNPPPLPSFNLEVK